RRNHVHDWIECALGDPISACKMKPIRSTRVWLSELSPLVFVLFWAVIALAFIYIGYRWIEPLPARRLSIAAVALAATYDNDARLSGGILTRHTVPLNVRNSVGGIENLHHLRDPASGVQAALSSFGPTESDDPETFKSLGGIFDAPIFIFYRNAQPITQFSA